ncbi:MAG: tetratricopeptide repeat protein [Bacteroidales bacterium]|nr:tetratricopeptide repeat protein [Bacteroidales bacterium]
MANNKLTEQEALQKEKLDTTVSSIERYYQENKKTFYGCVIAVLVIILGILAYNQWILKPKQVEAMQQLFPAEAAFQAGSYETALNGDGNVLGFKDIISQYGKKGGKAVYLYAGICELQLGNYQEAINMLKKYNGKDKILSARALACIGDAYVGLEDYNTAVSYFENAAKESDNMFSANYLLKAGITYEELGNETKALACYKEIKDKYPQSVEGYDIDKYISRIESK